MTSLKFLAIPAAVVGAIGLSAGAWAADPTSEQLIQQIEQLRTQVQQLEAKQAQALSARDVDATVEKVIQDAEKRSQMLQMEGFTAGWTKDRGFRIQSADGNWSLHPNFQFQFRSVTNFVHSGPVLDGDGDIVGFDGDDNIEHGFEVRRMKIGFDGNAFTPDLTYYFLWNSDRNGGDVFLEQAWIKYFFNDDWAFRLGQIRNPVFHEQDTSSSKQLAADRSMTNTLITGTNEAFSQAVTIVYDPKGSALMGEAGITDGFDSGNTDFLDGAEGNCGGFVRVNYFVKGTRAQYTDFSAMNNKEDLLVLGAGLDITQYDDDKSYLYTFDVQWENTGGLSVYAAYLGDLIDDDAADDTFHDWGLIVQAGYMINDAWEAFGRVGYTSFDEDAVPALFDDSYCEITAGANWYVGGGHNCKVTIDLTVLPNGAPTDITGLGILASDDTEVILRGQFQLLL